MFCKACGNQIPSQSRYCQYCGSPVPSDVNWTSGGVQGEPRTAYKEKTETASYTVVCPECGGHSIRFNSVSESRPVGCLAWTVILIGALCVDIVVFLVLLFIFLLVRRSTKAVTYGTCQTCGHRWKKKQRYEL